MPAYGMIPKMFGKYPRYNAKNPSFWYVLMPQSSKPLYCPVFPTANRVLMTYTITVQYVFSSADKTLPFNAFTPN